MSQSSCKTAVSRPFFGKCDVKRNAERCPRLACSLMGLQQVPEGQEKKLVVLILEENHNSRQTNVLPRKAFSCRVFHLFLNHEKKESCRQAYCTEGRLHVLGPIFFLYFFLLGSCLRMCLWMSFLIIWNVSDRKRKEACHPYIKVYGSF